MKKFTAALLTKVGGKSPSKPAAALPWSSSSALLEGGGGPPACSPAARSQSTPTSLLSASDPSLSRKRRNVLTELVLTEQNYVAALGHMLRGYKAPLTGVLSEAQLAAIFSISDLIYDFHCALATELQRLLDGYHDFVPIGACLLRQAAFLRSYSVYVNNYTQAVSTLSALEEQDARFADTLRALRTDAADGEQPLQSLYSYLVMPVQRVPRYLLLLDRLKKHTEPGHPDLPAIEQAIAVIAETATYIDEKRAQSESNQRMLALSMAVHGMPAGFSLLGTGRTLLHAAGMLWDKAGSAKKLHAFVLSDGLLLAKVRGRGKSSWSGRPRPTRASSSVSSSVVELGTAADAHLSHQIYQYLDWLPYGPQFAVTNLGAGRLALVRPPSLTPAYILREEIPQQPSLLDHLCAAMGTEKPAPELLPVPTPRSRRGSFMLLGAQNKTTTSLTPPAASQSTTPSSSSNQSTPPHDASAQMLSPRLASLIRYRRRQRTTSDPPSAVFAVQLSRSIMSVTGTACHDHATMVAAGFVAATALPLPQPPLSWAEVETDDDDVDDGHGLVALVPDHRYELGGRQLRPNLLLPPQFMYPELLGAFYQQHIAGRDHVVFFANTADKKQPVIVTVESSPLTPDSPYRRAVVRSKHGEMRTVLSPTGSLDECIAHMHELCPNVLASSSSSSLTLHWLRLPPDAAPQSLLSPRSRCNLAERLAAYDDDQQRMYTQLKIGVVPTKPGDMQQLSDRRMFATSAASPAFQEFLDFLGDTVPLRDYDGFAGGLDTTADMTGTHSVRAALDTDGQRFDIMFHVSTLLPHVDSDAQQLAKKRHIGNDIVVVVFHEDEQPFDPRTFISKMNQVFLVVKKVGTTDDQRPIYRLAFVCKGQAPSLPVLPYRPDFEASPAFRRFLLAKLVNAEATTHQTCLTFVARNRRARTSCLQEIIDTYTPVEMQH